MTCLHEKWRFVGSTHPAWPGTSNLAECRECSARAHMLFRGGRWEAVGGWYASPAHALAERMGGPNLGLRGADPDVVRAVNETISELVRARERYAAMHSAHEGYAVILEELEELKIEVFKKPSQVSFQKLRDEAMQVAAMGLRFMIDICTSEKLVEDPPTEEE